MPSDKTLVSLTAIFAIALLADLVHAQSLPDTDNGRYTLSPVPGGVVRLDTRTGIVSTCTDRGNGWACTAMPDERAALAAEIGRLQNDNDALKAQLAQRVPVMTGKIDEALPQDALPQEASPQDALPKEDLQKKSEPRLADGERKIEIPKIEIPLPSDRDMDRMMGFVENAWRRLVEMANRMQRDVSGKI